MTRQAILAPVAEEGGRFRPGERARLRRLDQADLLFQRGDRRPAQRRAHQAASRCRIPQSSHVSPGTFSHASAAGEFHVAASDEEE